MPPVPSEEEEENFPVMTEQTPIAVVIPGAGTTETSGSSTPPSSKSADRMGQNVITSPQLRIQKLRPLALLVFVSHPLFAGNKQN
jgi:hypothetical protein